MVSHAFQAAAIRVFPLRGQGHVPGKSATQIPDLCLRFTWHNQAHCTDSDPPPGVTTMFSSFLKFSTMPIATIALSICVRLDSPPGEVGARCGRVGAPIFFLSHAPRASLLQVVNSGAALQSGAHHCPCPCLPRGQLRLPNPPAARSTPSPGELLLPLALAPGSPHSRVCLTEFLRHRWHREGNSLLVFAIFPPHSSAQQMTREVVHVSRCSLSCAGSCDWARFNRERMWSSFLLQDFQES